MKLWISWENQLQILLVNSQWMRRWFTVSSFFFLQRQHQLARVRPRLLILSIVRAFPEVAVQVKKALCGGALTFQTLFHGNKQDFLTVKGYSSSSLHSRDCMLGSSTYNLSPPDGFSSTKGRGIWQGTPAPNSGLPEETRIPMDICAGGVQVIRH
jgi:hypothetical protein